MSEAAAARLRQRPPSPPPATGPSAKPAGTEAEGRMPRRPPTEPAPTAAAAATDPGEDAYSEGFHLWEDGRTTRRSRRFAPSPPLIPSIAARAMPTTSSAGRCSPRATRAARPQVLLANYRGNPRGERAPDSLFYLGQALMQLGQPGQACKAYAELESVYKTKASAPDLKKLLARGQVAGAVQLMC